MITTRAVLTASHGDRATDGSRLVTTCIDQITDMESFPPSLLVLLVTVGFEPFEDFLRGIQDTLRDRGLEVPLVGCSVAAIATEEDIVDNGAVLMCLASRFLSVKIGHAAGVREPSRKAVRSLLEQVDLIGDSDEFIPNPDGDKLLLCFLPGYYETDGVAQCDAPEIHALIREQIQASMPMVGGVAADNLERRRGWTFADGTVLSDGPVVALIKSDLRFGVALAHGLQETGDWFRVIESSENGRRISNLRSVDGSRQVEPPGEIIERYAGADLKAVLFGSAPPEEGERTILTPRDAGDGTVRLPKPVAKDATIEVLTTTPEQMLAARDECIRKSATKGRIDPYHIAGVLTFSCAGRLEYARRRNVATEDIVTGLRAKHPGVQFVGGFVYGEIGLGPLGRSLYRRWTISAVTFGDMLTQRALHMKVYLALAQAVRRMARDESEEEILSTALDAIIAAGFPGGMITLVYPNLDTKALKAKGARGRYWQAIVDQTIRWLDEEDILAVVAKSGKAEFIRDSREDPRCNPKAVEAARLISQYVVALKRENNEVIGTLQVDLGDMSNRPELPPELKGLLDAFGHQIAATLSHSFRLRELALADLFDRALVASTTADTIEQAAQRFIDEVVKEPNMLGTGMVHIRLARDEATALELVAGSGAYYEAALRERRVAPLLLPVGTIAEGAAEIPSARSFSRGQPEVVNLGATHDVTQTFLSSLPDGPLRQALGDGGAHINCLIRGGAESKPIGVVSFISREPWVFSESCWRSMSGLDKRLFVALKHAEEVSLRLSAARNSRTQLTTLFQITHDVFNLLADILGDVRTIVDDAEKGTELAKSAARVEGIVEDRTSRIKKQLSATSYGVRSVISGHELNGLLQVAVARAKQKALDRQVRMDVQESRPVGVRVNEAELITALYDLIDNGLNAMEPGGTLTVRVEPHWDLQQVRVTIGDNGCGIPEDLLETIRAGQRPPRDADGRQHLGWFVATEVITQCKGTLEVKSKIGRGTTVSIVLPCTEVSTCEETKDA